MKGIAIILALFVLFSIPMNESSVVVIETKMGKIKMELFENEAPITTSNFKRLVKIGFYDGLIFHRIVRNFVIQGGAFYPDGRYKESPYGNIPLEINESLKHVDMAVGMARAKEPDSASSQFYICVGAQHFLDGQYAVFGKVIKGMDVVRAINSFDPQYTYTRLGFANWPKGEIIDNVTMLKVYIQEEPEVVITEPENGSIVSGSIEIKGRAIAGENRTIKKVEIKIGNEWTVANGNETWSYKWDTRKVKNGEYEIEIRAFDGENYGIEKILVKVENKKTPGFDVAMLLLVILLLLGGRKMLR